MTERLRCNGTKVSTGERCRSSLNIGPGGFCLVHDPEREEQRKAMRANAVKASGAAAAAKRAPGAPALRIVPAAPETLEDAVKYFAWITHSVAAGTLDARTGHEAAYALNGFKAAVEKRDLQREVEELRRTVEELKKRPRLAA